MSLNDAFNEADGVNVTLMGNPPSNKAHQIMEPRKKIETGHGI